MRKRLPIVAAALAIMAVAAWFALTHASQPLLHVSRDDVPADGRFVPVAEFTVRHGRLREEALHMAGAAPDRLQTERLDNGGLRILFRAPVSGGVFRLRVDYGRRHWPLTLLSHADMQDRRGDGLPDSLRLHDAEDRARFRRWFTALADGAAALPDRDLPAEIADCSALLRYSYRLALLRHDDRWFKQFAPGTMPTLPSVTQWNYPETPLGAALFRITPPRGTPQAQDFAQFANAKTLYSLNSFRVGRDVRLARPGDLLFFHRLEQDSQYHSMIVTGEGGEWVVYHTGPESTGAKPSLGEMRRARIADLLAHPDPRWRPVASNANFLGVYRWNLLRED